MTFNSEIDVVKGSYIVDGKSALGILTMDLREPLEVKIHSEDKEEIKKFNMAMEEFKID